MIARANRQGYGDTRDALHQVAEHVVAAAQYAQTGQIRLRYLPGGFETVHSLRGIGRVGVVDGRLVVTDDTVERTAPLTTIAAAAEFVGVTAGLPADVYPPATALTPDKPLILQPRNVTLLAEWFGLTDAGLRTFAAAVGEPQLQPILWPEHFDLAITVDAVNYGGSPGDAQVDDPYLYVGPHAGPPRRDSYWNAEFGAVRTIREVRSADAAVAFFQDGRARLMVVPG